MTVAKAKSARNGVPEGQQLVWSLDDSNSVSFAPNVTPCTFNNPQTNMIVSTPDSFISEGGPKTHSKRKTAKSQAQKKSDSDSDEPRIPRPPNAFIIYRSTFIKERRIHRAVESDHSTISKIIGMTWKNMPLEERQEWEDKAKEALEEHRRKYPSYVYRPNNGPKTEKKTRKVGPKDETRCLKIAEFIRQGMEQSELNAAIEEFDRTHVHKIEARFDTPVTERDFGRRRRRSASTSNLPPPSSESSLDHLPEKPPTKRRKVAETASSSSVEDEQAPLDPDMPELCDAPPIFDDFSFMLDQPAEQFDPFSFDPTTSLITRKDEEPSISPLEVPHVIDTRPHLSIDTTSQLPSSHEFLQETCTPSTGDVTIPQTPSYFDMPQLGVDSFFSELFPGAAGVTTSPCFDSEYQPDAFVSSPCHETCDPASYESHPDKCSSGIGSFNTSYTPVVFQPPPMQDFVPDFYPSPFTPLFMPSPQYPAV